MSRFNYPLNFAKQIILAVFLCFSTFLIPAQIFTITKVELAGNDVLLYYNLIDSSANHTYTVSLYTSTDNFNSPLTKVTGDVGLEIKPGIGRKILWKASEELTETFTGDVALEVRGKIYIPFIKLDGFNDYKKFKRNKIYKITWTGGRGNNVLSFDLYKGKKKITTYPNIANVGEYKMKFEGVRPGKNYILKISDSKNKDDVVVTDSFKIKRKTPLLVKLIPLAVGSYFIVKIITEPSNNEIPNPVTPNGN